MHNLKARVAVLVLLLTSIGGFVLTTVEAYQSPTHLMVALPEVSRRLLESPLRLVLLVAGIVSGAWLILSREGKRSISGEPRVLLVIMICVTIACLLRLVFMR